MPRAESVDLVPALKRLAVTGGIDAPLALQGIPVEAAEWFVLARDGHAAAVATGPWTETGPAQRAQVVYLGRDGAGWKATGWAGCSLSPMLPEGQQWVQIDRVSAGRQTPEPTLLVHEIACTSGRDPRPYLLDPRVVETDDRVTVSWSSSSRIDSGAGMTTCVGNPPVPATVDLKSPLGARTLYDGSSWPARRVD